MAIFYRMNSLSRVMEDALRRANVPYQIARGVEFYNRKEIKDVLAYLRVIANPNDAVSLARIVNVPTRGVGDSSVKQMDVAAVANGVNLWQAMTQSDKVPGLSTRAVNSTKAFVQLVNRWRGLIGRLGPKDESIGDELPGLSRGTGEAPVPQELVTEPVRKGRVQSIMEDVVRTSGLESLYRKTGDQDLTELANVNELISSAAEYDNENPDGNLDDYLAQVSLVSDADHMKGAGGAVTLMTLHAAKGLEFPVVAMIGLEEGCLPHSRARGNLTELEEERRLCFVGITRAEQFLILTKAAYRTMRGLRERTITSPFLNELPQDKLDITDRTTLAFNDGQAARFDHDHRYDPTPTISGFRKGQLVRHPKFGVGRIAELSDMGQNTRAIVNFTSAGQKTLILEYARLEAVVG
jgi:DNA helicase-2/ATP-dependent DNA helicase PcrA